MLKVTDTGVTIALQSQHTTSNILTQILWTGILIAVIGILMATKIVSVGIGAILILVVIMASFVWQRVTRKKANPTLTGGELHLTQQGFTHQQSGKAISYQLLDTDRTESTNDGLTIRNANGETLYHIQGFNDPKHIEIAQAVMQGKSIKTQGKAIKLQSS